MVFFLLRNFFLSHMKNERRKTKDLEESKGYQHPSGGNERREPQIQHIVVGIKKESKCGSKIASVAIKRDVWQDTSRVFFF